MFNKRKSNKGFIIGAIAIIAVVVIGMMIHSHNTRAPYYDSYGTSYHHDDSSLGRSVANSAIKGAVSGYVAGKVMNHYANKNKASYNTNTSSYGHHYYGDASNGSFSHSNRSSSHHSGRR